MTGSGIQIDRRTGSADMLLRLQQRRIPCQMTTLEYGDAAFIGDGPGGCPVSVGVELKQVRDALQCMTDGRFAGHQLPGLVANYNYVWLVVEGIFRPHHQNGMLEMRAGKQWKPVALGQRQFMYREFDAWLRTMEIKAGIRIWRTSDRIETTQWLSDLYGWWTAKEWEEHRGHLAFSGTSDCDAALLVRPGLVRRVAKELPGVGWKRSGEVASAFSSVVELAMAEPGDLSGLPGIGKVTAEKIVRAMRGEGEGR